MSQENYRLDISYIDFDEWKKKLVWRKHEGIKEKEKQLWKAAVFR